MMLQKKLNLESGDLMSLSEKMTGLANAVRSVSDTSEKLGIDDMKSVISQLGNFHDFGEMPSGTDANECIKSGVYNVRDYGKYKNIPSSSYGVLAVLSPLSGVAYAVQLYASVDAGGSFYLRVKNGAFGWTAWKKLGGGKARPNGFLPHFERGRSVCRLAVL